MGTCSARMISCGHMQPQYDRMRVVAFESRIPTTLVTMCVVSGIPDSTPLFVVCNIRSVLFVVWTQLFVVWHIRSDLTALFVVWTPLFVVWHIRSDLTALLVYAYFKTICSSMLKPYLITWPLMEYTPRLSCCVKCNTDFTLSTDSSQAPRDSSHDSSQLYSSSQRMHTDNIDV